MTTAILFLDLESGWGGSSRSLMNMVAALDRKLWKPVVVLRKDGPAVAHYEAAGIDFVVETELPSFRPSERKNLISWLLYRWAARKLPGALNRLQALAEKHDCRLIHVNHESLALAGRALAKRLGLPWVCHIRTQLIPGFFARSLARMIATQASHLVFISEPVESHFRSLLPSRDTGAAGSVLYNICLPPPAGSEEPDCMAGFQDGLKVISLSNFSPNRGVDRVVEIATVLKKRGIEDIRFFLFGRPAHRHPVTGKPAPYYQSIVDTIAENGLQDMVMLPGHIANPNGALSHGDALIKLTRQQNPWGRDIMEGIAAGIPVITLGHFDKFVEMGRNGYLAAEYNPESIADFLTRLRNDPELRAEFKTRNKEKAETLFGPQRMADGIGRVYDSVLARR
ncbi:glycosyltransferase family 4 protein [Hwanghaeella sp.]|uniref:glycosyltransferase family 4 protein n=1 Tax=Hwanghaeella sp. TaxID=2605943 RepID=UPI003CCBB4DF